MFAQLTYDAGASLVNVLNDISIALTGGSTSSMSANLNQAQSSIDNVPGGAPTWVAVTDPTNFSDNHSLSSTTYLGAKIVKQPASTSTGTPDKFLKFGFTNVTPAPTVVLFTINMGKANSSGSLSGDTKFFGYTHCTTEVGIRNGGIFTGALRVQIYSSASATLIQIAHNDLFSFKPCLAVLDFPKNDADFATAGNICTVVSNCVKQGDTQNHMYITVSTLDGKSYPTDTTNSSERSSVFIGTPEISNVLDLLYNSNYKFEGFSTIGTKYDLLNIGVTKLNLVNTETQGQVWYTDNTLYRQIPYSSITDVTGVYGCHAEAFGKSGAFYDTPLGTMCKFGIFMVGV